MMRFGALIAGVVCSTVAMAAAVTPSSPAERHLVESGSTIENRFVSSSGLTAIVADNGQEQRLFYLTPNGEGLILGVVFDAQGRNVTQKDMALAAQSNHASTGAARGQTSSASGESVNAWERAERSTWIPSGDKGKVVYAIYDPNCPYCHRLHDALKAFVHQGKVQVRWIPVSILSDTGAGLIASTLAAEDPVAAMGAAFNRTLAASSVTPTVKLAIAKNVLLLRDVGLTGVPVLIYQQGGQTVVQQGLPTPDQLVNAVTN